MKKIISTMMCLGAVIIALTACSDDTETKVLAVPTVTLSPSSVTLSSEAVESYTISYTVSNPGDGASVSATADADWISGFDYSVWGEVSFTVAATSEQGLRTATITVSYAGLEKEVDVVQDRAGAPSLSVSPASISAPYEGGEFSFTYTIENPVEGESVNITADVNWITNITDNDATVTFTVGENGNPEPRTGTITASYVESVKTVTVNQGFDTGEISLVGTYTASGYDYAGEMTWTLRIFEYDGSATAPVTYSYSGDYGYYVDGFTPSNEGDYHYYGDHRCSAAAYLDGDGTFHVPSQILNTTSSGYYLGYTPCTEYDGSSWYYSSYYPDVTFTMKSSDTWESDYGVFLGAFSSRAFTRFGTATFSGFFDVVAPTITINKVSDDPNYGADSGDGGDDSGDGSGGGDVDLSEFVGTYSAYGYGRVSGGYDYATWDMYITEVDGVAYAYCLTPYAGGLDIAGAGSSY